MFDVVQARIKELFLSFSNQDKIYRNLQQKLTVNDINP